MQEHIQQVSLSELMTSWSHILPHPLWWGGGVKGGARGGILFRRWINKRRGALAPPLEEMILDL